ncbi:BRMS1 [Bugula neritina]|uniref:BRMS1 n=1 Tax=Bugula neritina TaxID=10212 RepID=A0A7J7IUB1_BUGNE|nr:BRMS1 [Bugula neritina]
MLEETDIIEDWTMIKKAVKQKQQFQRRGHVVRSVSTAKDKIIKYRGGRLLYKGENYSKGHRIIIDYQDNSPVHGRITGIEDENVYITKSDGNKVKLLIAQMQRGKYSIRHAPY